MYHFKHHSHGHYFKLSIQRYNTSDCSLFFFLSVLYATEAYPTSRVQWRRGVDLSERGACKTQGRDEGHFHSNISRSYHASSSRASWKQAYWDSCAMTWNMYATGSRTKTTDTIQIWHTICIRYISVESTVDRFPPCALSDRPFHQSNRTLRAQQQVISAKPFTRAI